ncbi:hypothetical protein L1049_006247 [Liquidambar formosana]|uniref:SHSP domain-containing protein n=1 Tax=Liquidambar formosana TaxID=63359 RepID=A0AAP0RF70_LIQFO
MSPPLPYRPYCTKEDEEGLYMRLEMPGVGKEGMRIWVENETLLFEGKELKDENETIARHYSGSLSTFIASYELNETKATMKNGVLRMMIPKKKKKKLE